MKEAARAESGPPTPCPCGSARFAACCGRFLDAGEAPTSAEQLMRSRYSAYALHRAGYIASSWHASTRPHDVLSTVAENDRTRWIGLKIVATAQQDDDHASVEFVARYRIGGRAHRLHERSRFVREAGRWLYVDGEMLESA